MDKYPKFWNEETETMGREELRKIEEKKFLKEMEYVYRKSPFYQKKFQEAGLELGDIKGLEDIAKIPFTEKDEIRKSQETNPPLGRHIACSMEDVVRVYSTSGTTGRPTFIGLTKHDRDNVWRKITTRVIWTWGLRPDDVVAFAVGSFFVAAAAQDGIEEIGATVVPVGLGATDRFVAAFQYLGANATFGTASSALYFADYLPKKGIDPRTFGIRRFVVGGEPGGSIPAVRKKVEDAFGCILVEGMGLGDICGGIWAECDFKQGMHFCGQGLVLPEIIDPNTGKVLELKDGLRGELVYSCIDRECMPLIRFRSHDQIVVIGTEKCECGRTGYRIRCVGRTDDMLIVQGVNVYPSAIKDVASGLIPRTTGEIQIQLEKPGHKVEPPLKIKIEYGKEPGDLGKLKNQLEDLYRSKLICRAEVDLVPEGSLPRFEYKAQLVKKLYEE